MIRRAEAFLGSRRYPVRRKVQAGILAAVVTMTAGVGFAIAASDPSPTAMQSLVRINAGGESMTDWQGLTWDADTGVGGETGKTDKEINGAWDQELFQTQRTGAMTYAIPVSPGKHTVRLYFAAFESAASPFNVMFEDKTLITGYDIAKTAGTLTADVAQMVVENDESLDLTLTQGASLAGIEVLKEVNRADLPDTALTDVPVANIEPATPTEPTGSDQVTEAELANIQSGSANHEGEDHSGGAASGTGTTETKPAADTALTAPEPLAAPGAATPEPTTAPTTTTAPTATPAPSAGAAASPSASSPDLSGSDQVTENELMGQAAAPASAGADSPAVTPTIEIEPTVPAVNTKPPTKASTGTTTKSAGKSAYRMNVGGKAFTKDGLTWRADTGSGGTTSVIDLPEGAHQALGSVRHGPQKFNLPVLNGSYQLDLKFLTSSSFDVKIENISVATDKTVEAGSVSTMSVPVTITDGVLDIEITSESDQSPALASLELMMPDTPATGADTGDGGSVCTMEMLMIDGKAVTEHPDIKQPAHKDDKCQWVDGDGKPISTTEKAPTATPAATPAATATDAPDPIFGEPGSDWTTVERLLGQSDASAQPPATGTDASTADTGVTTTG